MPTPLLTIDGTQYKPMPDGTAYRPSVVAGEDTRSFSGRALSTVHGAGKMEMDVALKPMLPAVAAALETLITENAYLPVGGRLVTDRLGLDAEDTIDAVVRIVSDGIVRGATVGSYLRALTLSVQEA